MNIVIAIIIVLGVAVGFLIFFLIKSLAAPKRVEVLANLLKNGKVQTAIKTAKAIIAKDQRNAEAHYYLGKAYLAENKAELALMEFKAVNQIGLIGQNIPESDFRQNMAQLYVKFGQIEEALKEYVLLIKLDPRKADNYYWAGKLFMERNRSDMALNYLRKAAELSPRDGKVHYELGAMLYKDKKSSEARAELETALKFQPDNAQAHFYLGKLQKDSKDYNAALASFEKAQRDAQFKIKALVERGGIYMSMNAVDKAIPELERAVKAITDDGNQDALYARYFLAMCFEKNRELDKAIAQWDKIYAKKKNFRDVGEKLSQYQEFRADDKMKDYLTAGQAEYLELCKAIVTQSMALQVQDMKSLPNGCDIIAMENDSAKWRNVRKMPRLIRFFRMPEMVDETKIRDILEEIKKLNITRAVIITSSGFSRPAAEFADSRPVELFGKDQLQNLMQNVELKGTSPKRR
ncbi:tetratricopeptide repeat protein [Breznakiella homolactica]|uniref:Tetratricopeptide repeat protein n=1 Tax=Breznakiella homolactica TaxID=2798577 RepID=A0A7T8B8G8_9SPIR|nr:tetratricopeptide repeat protein [Breznakiella homolactica]QQO08584.1 tetratricopeptide repeat protein [Breznakiella homolactica]